MAQNVLLITPDRVLIEPFARMLTPDYGLLHADDLSGGAALLRARENAIAAALIDIELTLGADFSAERVLGEGAYFSPVPLLAAAPNVPAACEMERLNPAIFDIIAPICPPSMALRRIRNAIHAKDSMTMLEIEQMLRALPSCIYLKDTESRYVFSTQIWHHVNHPDDPNWSMRGFTDLDIRKNRENALKAMAADRRIIETGEGSNYIIEEVEDGIHEYLELIKRPMFDTDGRVSGIVGLINNVTELQLMKKELEHRANTDPLTGLLNKRSTEEMIDMILGSRRGQSELCALMMIDADHFKTINDTFGHREGDRVLTEIGRTLQRSIRANDVAGRIGGDEFMIFLRNISAPKDAGTFAARLVNRLTETFASDPIGPYVSLSIGIALGPEHGRQFEALYKAADAALYAVKRNGRNGFRLYTPENGFETT